MTGQWTVLDRGGMGYDVEGPMPGLRGMFEHEEDARKAAAAPELIDQLECMVNIFESDDNTTLESVVILDAKELIAEARGE